MRPPKPGDHYIIRRPTGILRGQVVDVIGSGDTAHVVVRVPVHGAMGEALDDQLLTIPVRRLVQVDDQAAKAAAE
jgi:hypothetical protein